MITLQLIEGCISVKRRGGFRNSEPFGGHIVVIDIGRRWEKVHVVPKFGENIDVLIDISYTGIKS